MENPNKNKITAEVFSRYLKTRLNRKYNAVLPKQVNDPIDAKLTLKGHKSLLLQLKQVIDFESREKILSRSSIKIFRNSTIEVIVKKAEEKYKELAKSLILVLHVDEGYLIPSDSDIINRNNFIDSTFRGIYMISPKQELWKAGVGKRIQNEFVFEIKNAFRKF